MSLLWKDYGLTIFLVGKQRTMHLTCLLILQGFTNHLPSQDFNIYRTSTEKFMSSDFIKLFIVPQKSVGVLSNTCLP